MKKRLALAYSVFFIFILNIIFYDPIVVQALVDSEGPVVNSITLDKYTVERGQSIKITIDGSDESGLSYANIRYNAPSGGRYKNITLNKDEATGKLIGNIDIGSGDAAGKWSIQYIFVYDAVGNKTYFGSYPEITFEVVGEAIDSEGPVVNSITLDKYTVERGQSIKITIDGSDESGLSYANIQYNAPSGGRYKYITLNKDETTGKLIGNIDIGSEDESGKWTVGYVFVYDTRGNQTYFGSYPEITFEVVEGILIQPLEDSCVKSSEYWSAKVVNSDLYIGPESVITINGSVTVNGNIYVLGALKNYGNLIVTGAIYARQFIWGDSTSTLYNGTVLMLGGTNSISSMIASNQAIDISLKIYESNEKNQIDAYDGTLSITGATLPIIDLYIDGTKINYYSNGTFSLDLDVTNKYSINIQTIDVYGNVKNIIYNINHKSYDANNDGYINILDLAAVSQYYNTKGSLQGWKSQFDYNNDNMIDIFDLVKISKKMS